MTEHHDNFFQEVDEDVRLEKLEKFWKRYQNHILGGLLAVALVVGGGTYLNHRKEISQEALSKTYAEALIKLQKGEKEEGIKLLDSLKDEKGYGALAMLMKASVLAKEPATLPEALKVYEEMSKNTSYDKNIALLAGLMRSFNELDSGNIETVRHDLEELNNDDNPWQPLVMELLAALEDKAGNKDKAKELYTQLADDARASQSMRARALAILTDYK